MLGVLAVGLLFSTGCFSSMFWSNTVKQDEEIIFFPTIGSYHKADGFWRLDIHGWIFEPEFAGEIRRLFRRALGNRPDKENPSIFRQRSAPFLVDNERGKRITVAIGEHHFVVPQRSAPNGHFRAQIHVPAPIIEQYGKKGFVTFRAVLSHNDNRVFSGRVHLIDNDGVSIVSDIDDTIKISEVHDKKKLMLNTFYRPFLPTPGMADYYQLLSYLPQASFHYVTSSPWQLFEALEKFRSDNHFPPGTYHMKLFRWKDRSVANLFTSPITFKLGLIEPIMQRFPGRQFILIGDSGEKDPEIYGDLARRYPKQVQKILIRDTQADTPADNKTRYDSAFHDVPKKRWLVFNKPEEIP